MRKKKKVKNSNNITKSSIACTSNVTISLQYGKKAYREIKVHNTAKLDFFRRILLAIAGEYATKILMPQYLHTFDSTGVSTTSISVPITSKKVYYDNTLENYRLDFEFLIPYTILSSEVNTGILRLYSSKAFDASQTNNILLEVTLPEDKQFKSDGSTNAVVSWTISIDNLK